MKKISMMILTGLAGIITAFADIAISPTSRDWAANGGGATVSTLGSGSWTATTDVSWITLVKSTGTAGDACSYLVAKNPDADARVGHITIAGMVFTVTQQGCSVELSPASATFSCTGGLGKFTAIMDVAVTWTASPSDSWIKISPSSGIGPTEISYTVAAFDEVGSRTGTIRIGSDSFTINQTGVDVTLSPTVTNITKDVCIVPVQVVAMTGVRWTVTPNVSWISVLDGGSGFGGSQITLVAAENPSVAKRTGTVSVGSATLTVIQEGTDDVSFRILPEVAEASPNGAFGNVAVYATPDATWSAESLDDWIRITAGAEGAGNGNVKYVTLSNPEQTNRTGRIKFTPPVHMPDIDLHAGLVMWIQEQDNIEGNELRRTTYPLSKEFDGSFYNPLTGAALPARADQDYTFSVTFKVGELGCVNRLMMVGDDTLYLDSDNVLWYEDQKTSFAVSAVDTYYTVVLRMSAQHKLDIYAGEMNTELAMVFSGASDNFLDFSSTCPLNQFCLGYGMVPSVGTLSSGRFAELRFWSRALSDEECVKCDSMHDNPAVKWCPKGCPVDKEWACFPLDGNAFWTTNEVVETGTELVASLKYFDCVRDMMGASCRAVSSGRLVIKSFPLLFRGRYLLNGGLPWFGENLRGYQCIGDTWVPHAAIIAPESCTDGTYALWVKFREGTTGLQDIFHRTVKLYSNAFGSNVEPLYSNREFLLSLGLSKLKIVDGDGERIVPINKTLAEDAWHFVVIAGRSERSLVIYIDGEECCSVPSKLMLGYLPTVVDRRTVTYNYDGNFPRYDHGGAIVDCGVAMTVGCEAIAGMDAFQVYQGALSAAEVKHLYEEQQLKYVYHTVKQGIQQLELSVDRIEIGKAGGASNVTLTVANGVKWTVVPDVDWLSVAGSPSGAGSANLNVQIAPNPTIVQRTGTMQIGAKTLTVVQEGLNCAVTVDQTLFDVESSMGVIEVSPEQNGSWTISTDVDWISLAVDSGIGSADVYFFVDYFDDPDMSRTGTITVGDKSIYITQRGYELSIEPMIANAGGNAGAGEIGVAADIDSIWTAIASVPWIRIEQGADGIGSGTVRYTFTENTTGQIRTGHIRISGEEYTVNQMYRVAMSVGVEGRGSVTGAGNYDYGDDVTLTAVPEAGYVFSHWSGAASGTANPVTIRIDEACKATAHFTPAVPVAAATTAERYGVTISWGALAWAEQYRVYRAEANQKPEAPMATIAKGTLAWKDTAATPGQTYYYWVEAVGAQEQTTSAAVTGKRAVTLTDVTISCVSELFAGASAICTCTAAYNDGTSKGVAPNWSVDGAGATIDASGVLTATAVEADMVVTVRASHTEGGITETASAQVTICPTVALGDVATGVGDVTTGGSGAWFGQTRDSCGGAPALRSPRLAGGSSAWVGCSVAGAGTLTFKWRKEGADAGKLALTVNGSEAAACGDASDTWVTVTKEFLDGGAKTLRWTVTGGANADAYGLVAEICWTPGTAIAVDFDANGGSGSMAGMAFLQGADKTLTANAFARTGYAFAGWATSADGDVACADCASVVDMVAPVGGVITLYAKWTANGYEVAFDANGGTGAMADEPMTYDAEKALTACVFTRTGHAFAGWATSAGGAVKYADGATVKNLAASGTATLYAKWTPNSYVVDFNPGQGGTGTMPDQPMTYDEEAALYANLFARTGYTFLGWTDDENELEEVLYFDGVVVSNLTAETDGEFDLYAIWAANEYAVRFNANGGSGTMADQAFVYDAPQALAACAFARTGFSFAGWAKTAGGAVAHAGGAVVENLTAEPDGVVALYAKWTANVYSVAFDANGGDGFMEPVDCTYGTAQALPANAFARTCYMFAGWATSADGAVAYADGANVTTMAASGVATLYAKWTPIPYSVKFNANGGDGTMANEPMTYDVEKTLTVCAFKKTGYAFAGWATSADGDVVYADGQSMKNLTAAAGGVVELHAKWAANGYVVAFDANGGCGSMANAAFIYDAAAKALTSNAFARTGYDFAGWATSADGAVKYADGASVRNLAASGTVTLHAKWTPHEYAVDFNPGQGGEGSMPDQPMTYGEAEALCRNLFTRTGYTFLGWTDDENELEEVLYFDGVVVSNLTDETDGEFDLYAIWAANEYVVKFDANGGNGSMDPQSFTYDAEQMLPPNLFKFDNHAFVGWSRTQNGDSEFVDMDLVVNLAAEDGSVITLYAVWTNRFPDFEIVDGVLEKYTGAGGEVTIPSSVTSIGGWAFDGCGGLKSVTIPLSVTSIGDCAFAGCSGLTSVTIPSSVTSIGGWAFSNCHGLTSVTIPSSVTSIGSGAFAWCHGLKSVTIPLSVTSIGEGAFRGCSGLESFVVDSSNPSYCSRDGLLCSKDGTALVAGVNGDVTIPEGVTSIGNDAFDACGGLKSVTIPSSVTSIGNSAFSACNGLTTVTIPSSVTSIGGWAFWGCDSLSTVYVDAGDSERIKGLLESSGFDTGMLAVTDVPPVRTVTFIANGGTCSTASKQYSGGATLGTLPTATRAGFAFDGWYTAANGGTKVSSTTVVTGDVTLYAHWTADPSAPANDDFANATQISGASGSATGSNAGATGESGEASHGESGATNSIWWKWTAPSSGRATFTTEGSSFDTGIAVYVGTSVGALDLIDANGDVESGRWSSVTFDAVSGVTYRIAVAGYHGGEGSVKLNWNLTAVSTTCTVAFNANGGTCSTASKQYTGGATLGTLPTATRSGYTFDGWYTAASGGTKESSSTVVTGNVTLYAHWTAIRYAITYNLNGGSNSSANPATYTVEDTVTLAAPTRAGYKFLGWTPNGGAIARGSIGDKAFTANWEKTSGPSPVDPVHPVEEPPVLVDESSTHVDVVGGEEAPYEKAAAVYDGYLYDADGNVAGAVQVKVAKGKVDKSGEFVAKATATVQLAGSTKKLSFKGGVADAAGGVTEMADKNGNVLAASLGVNGLGGELRRAGDSAPYRIDGARNIFSAKDAKTMAVAAEDAWVGAVNVVGGDVALAVSIANKGKVKVSGTVGGAKVSATSQLLVGDGGVCCVPVVITKKANLAFNLWLLPDGGVELVGLDAEAGKAGTLKPGAAFWMGDAEAAFGTAGIRALPYLPDGVPVAANGKKWVVAPDEKGKAAKAGKIKLVDGDPVDVQDSANPSGLKLTYTAKSGTFKGSFKAYTLVNGKIKSYTVNVAGVMLGDRALGTATLKTPAVSFPIAIE